MPFDGRRDDEGSKREDGFNLVVIPTEFAKGDEWRDLSQQPFGCRRFLDCGTHHLVHPCARNDKGVWLIDS